MMGRVREKANDGVVKGEMCLGTNDGGGEGRKK